MNWFIDFILLFFFQKEAKMKTECIDEKNVICR